jgi:hypothetical protein
LDVLVAEGWGGRPAQDVLDAVARKGFAGLPDLPLPQGGEQAADVRRGRL